MGHNIRKLQGVVCLDRLCEQLCVRGSYLAPMLLFKMSLQHRSGQVRQAIP